VLPRLQPHTAPVRLLVDSTGLRLGGHGEWLVEKHGSKRRRAWGIVNLTSCIRILNRSMEHNAFMLSSEHTSPGPKP
jgi:hypothetical protein